MVEKTKLTLISSTLYTAKYIVSGGEMNSKIVQIMYGFPDLLRQEQAKFKGYQDFELDIIGALNILNYQGDIVTDDVLQTFNSDFDPESEIVTGTWNKGKGWSTI